MIRCTQTLVSRSRLCSWFSWPAMLALLLAAALAFAACFGGDEPTEAPAPPPASDDPQQTEPPAAQPAAQPQQQTQQPQSVATTSQTDAAEEQVGGADQQQGSSLPVAVNEYIVQSGDTLAAIANAHDVRLDDLIRLNNIQNPNQLSVGQRLIIPGDEPQETTTLPETEQSEDAAPPETATAQEEEAVDTPTVTLPNTAVALATPTSTSASQFAQPGPDATLSSIPSAPASFIQYGADLLPWMHGRTMVDEIVDVFFNWPMPPLVSGNDRLTLVDTNGDGQFSAAMVFTDPTSFGAAVPFSNLVVYDPLPGRPDRYRIGYDHRLAYGREVQGLQVLSDLDLTGDGVRDITFREVSCSGGSCVSAFYILRSVGDGYSVLTGADAQVNDIEGIQIADGTADGVLDLVVAGVALDDGQSYSFTLSIQAGALVEVSRIPQSE